MPPARLQTDILLTTAAACTWIVLHLDLLLVRFLCCIQGLSDL